MITIAPLVRLHQCIARGTKKKAQISSKIKIREKHVEIRMQIVSRFSVFLHSFYDGWIWCVSKMNRAKGKSNNQMWNTKRCTNVSKKKNKKKKKKKKLFPFNLVFLFQMRCWWLRFSRSVPSTNYIYISFDCHQRHCEVWCGFRCDSKITYVFLC